MNIWNKLIITEKVRLSADQYGASNPRQLNQLMLDCSHTPDREVFFGLFSFFYGLALQENAIQRQQLSGTILLTLSPTSPLNLEGSVYAATKMWDYSIKELPWYWCKTFGKKSVIDFLSELIPDCFDVDLKVSIETMLFWSKAYKCVT